jgi:LPPG:FO 2-phospho-L-lactate transferase
VAVRLLPMSDQPVPTHVLTPVGELHFEEYFVRRRAQDEVLEVRYVGVEAARPAPGVLEAIHDAEAILIAPSNPIVSVGTILAVPGVREALRATQAPVVAVSPIVGGAAIKGRPRRSCTRWLRCRRAAWRPAAGLADLLVIDRVDAGLADDPRGRDGRCDAGDLRGPAERAGAGGMLRRAN